MNKLYTFLILCFIAANQLFGQVSSQQEIARDSAIVLFQISNEKLLQTDIKGSLRFAIQAVEQAQLANNEEVEGDAYLALANAYEAQGDYENAEKYFTKVNSIGESLENIDFLSASAVGLGNVLSSNPDTVEESITYYEKAADYTLQSDDPGRVFIAATNASSVLLEYGKSDRAKKYIDLALSNYKEYQAKLPLYDITLLLVQAEYSKQKGQYQKAQDFLRNAEILAIENDFLIDLIEITQEKSDVYKLQKKFDKALESQIELQTLKDRNLDAIKSEQLEEIKAKFQLEQYERELSISQKEKAQLSRITFLTVLGSLLFFAILGLLFYFYKNRKKRSVLELRNQALVEAKENAERLTNLKTRFLSRISHELRTPLYGVVGITSMLKEDQALSTHNKELVDSLKFSGDHLINLVNDIFKISQIESESIELNLKPFNLKESIQDIINSFKFQAKQNNNKLHIHIDEGVKEYYNVDALRFSEVIMNLLSNALENTVDGDISLHVLINEIGEKYHQLEFKIKDTGKGISKDHQRSIYDNFNQINTEENVESGAGLGLTIVKHLLALMGSEIKLESEVAKGSTFSFNLNLEPTIQEVSQVTESNFSTQTKKILIAEDNKLSQMVTGNLIKIIGHEFVIAQNGQEAYEQVQKESFDLVLMDLNMPVMNGYDATKEIHATHPDLKIIALTATNVNEVEEKCLNMGMVEVINKPLGKSELYQILSKYF